MKMHFFSLIILTSILFVVSCQDDDAIMTTSQVGLVSYLSFDDHLQDSTGQTGSSENLDSITFVDGVRGRALSFNDETQFVLFDRDNFVEGQELSISVWFKARQNDYVTHFIMCSDFIITSSRERVAMAISIPNTNSAGGDFIEDEWTHFVGTYDGHIIQCYLNGTLVQTTEHQGELSDPDRLLRLGGSGWIGMIDELYIFDMILSPSEIRDLYEI